MGNLNSEKNANNNIQAGYLGGETTWTVFIIFAICSSGASLAAGVVPITVGSFLMITVAIIKITAFKQPIPTLLRSFWMPLFAALHPLTENFGGLYDDEGQHLDSGLIMFFAMLFQLLALLRPHPDDSNPTMFPIHMLFKFIVGGILCLVLLIYCMSVSGFNAA